MNIEEKRQEIREGLTLLFSDCYSKEGSACPIHPVFQPQKAINKLLPFLDSQGVEIIDKEAEPKRVNDKDCICVGDCNITCHSSQTKYTQHDMLEADFHKHYRLIDE